MSNPIRFAIVGCGAVTRKHLTALSRIDSAEAVALCDTVPAAVEALASEFGVKGVYTDMHEMSEREEIDVYSILTPSGSHADIQIALAPYGRDFVVEKPMALRLADADRMIRACDQYGGKLFVVHQNRYNKPIIKLKEAIDSGRFGKLVMGTVRVRWCRRQEYYDAKGWRGTWAQDGGVLTNQASHHLDMLSWLMGDVESVMGMTSTRLSNIEAEDVGTALLRFVDGSLGIIEATTATRPKDLEGSVSILGENGSVEVGGFFMNELKTWQFEDERPEDATIFEEWGANPKEWAWNHTEYLRDVIGCINDNRRGLVDGLEGRKSLELINSIYESAETETQVALRFRPKKCRLGMPAHD